MTIAQRAGVAATAVALGIGLSACGSDTPGEATKAAETSVTSESAATSAPDTPPPTSSAPATPPGLTLDQYIADNAISSSDVQQGDPDAPTITLPFPPGWEAAGPGTPQGAYAALTYTGPPPSPNPPTIVAFLSKLTGEVDPAKILEYAPNDTRELPGFQGASAGQKSSLAGYEATQIGGFYTKDGGTWLIAQKTVVIPAQDGVYVLKITAEGSEDLAMQLMDATAAIDDQTTITL